MELVSKCFGIDVNIHELIKLIPETTWKNVENQLLIQANKDYEGDFKSIDLWDSEGKLSFGVSD